MQPQEATETIRRLIRQGIAAQAVILSTCHRIEVYATGVREPSALGQFLCDDRGLTWADVQAFARSLAGPEAATHLFRVAAGLDSMITGESQILGQVRTAYAEAKLAGNIGPELDGLFRWAIHVGRRVRRETALGTGGRSLGAHAVTIASAQLAGLGGRTVMILGAGTMARAVAAKARQEDAIVLVVSRTIARARQLAGPKGEAIPLDQLGRGLVRADLLVCCAATSSPVVTQDQLRMAGIARGGRPLLVVDLSVPRVVDPGAKLLPGIELIDLEGLAEAGAATDQMLAPGIEDAEAIVEQEIQWYSEWMAGRQAGDVIAALRSRVETICSLELERCLAGRSSLSRTEAREVLRRSLAKLLHAPTMAARRALLAGDNELIANEFQIFGLDESGVIPLTRTLAKG